jgi:hypothetical protein
MRNILGVLGLVAITTASAQNLERVEVVKVDSTRTAVYLYRTAERWFVDTFKDAQEVIQLRDTTSHILVGKGMGQATMIWEKPTFVAVPILFSYTVEVEAKDGRYRVKVYNMIYQPAGGPSSPIMDTPCCHDIAACNYVPKTKTEQKYDAETKSSQISVCEQIRAEVATLLSSLNLAMTKAKDDW